MPYLIRQTALSLAIVTASCVGVSLPARAVDHQHAVEQVFDVAPGPLDQALTRFADQAGLRLMVASEVVTRQHSQGLHGRYAVQQGLDRLLLGSGLSARLSGDVILVERTPALGAALELGTTTIQGQGMGQMTENTGSYTPSLTSVGSKTPTSLRQTPQSVSVITHQVIQDKGMVDLTDAMKMTPGITVRNSNERINDFYSRGFAIENIQIDGAAPMALGTTAGSFYSSKVYNLAEFDHVEVLRGASGLFGGTGDPGGIINLVRKRPLDTYQLKFEASAGSWDNYRSQVDITGPMGFDGKLRGRLVAAYTDRQYFMDERSSQSPTLYGILEADVLPSTRLTIGGRSERINENGASAGLPRYSDGKDLGLPRHTNLSESWAFQDGRSDEVFAKVDHELSDDWKLNVSYTQTQDSGLQKRAFNVGSVNPVTGTGATRFGSVARYRSDQQLADVNLAGKFNLFDRQHEFLMGADHQRITSQWRGTGQLAGAFEPINVFDPGSTPWPNPPTTKDWLADYNPNTQIQYGLYSTLRLQLAEPLHLIVGARAQRYKFYQTYQERGVAPAYLSTREPTKVVPYGGVVYDLNDEWSAYASYSEIFKPQQNKLEGPTPAPGTESSNSIEPMTGKTYETGIKGELWGGAVNTSFALYYTKREHEAVLDPAYPVTTVPFGGSCCYVTQGEVVSKGVDMEVSGELLPDWSLMAGYTYNHNQNRNDDTVFSSLTPKHLFKLWSTYRLPGEFNDLKIGGGVNLQSANYVSGTAAVLDNTGAVIRNESYEYRQAGYAVWNAMAEYRLDDHWSLTYNLNNVFDKTYYSTVGSSVAANWYGEPRNHMLTLRGTFW
ncbi:TonB-dependent siderophore receptor [Pseudomonas qingdaonensis]|jgi:outer membrane receptor for ferric coprogen and ferric-rhodotorulic acid|uniref:TonB-dependent siderophore receptor n=1 Tax=Pseudomonas qingdaonensis TaxID=2056231 RepID=A0ABX8DXH6_9PSED|nr:MULTISPECIES: TonB-dependent siderophore receptor [Pseudomonas]MEC6746820.1 TonB-dependent siderophore receptor [Pseudomonas qingdaonensis]QVL20729.1 TonB-dependent siderophore receptor [Pseudomonas qingdaonensis]UVL52926.1 TonB-dependent siderophore receptor [Pseudomonas sp. B21-036]